MQRRNFIALLGGATLSKLAGPLPLNAQQSARSVIGFLSSTSKDGAAPYIAGLGRGLAEVGYADGRNLEIEFRWADDQIDRLPGLAADLVQQKVSVIVASAIRASLAAKAATSTIPVVFATANDPVQFGLVASLNRPGGNLTGVSYLSAELGEKRMQLLHELVPAASAIAVMVNPTNANAERNVRNVETAAHGIGLRTYLLTASTKKDFESAFARSAGPPADALLVLNDPLFFDQRSQITALAARYAVPVMYANRDYAEAGGLISYGANLTDAYRQVGVYVGRILKGEKPADLPVLLPTKFELVINLKTAKALGLVVSASLLARADEVIE
jgi:putative tryptophan/tyrosine transport system substrate-binding protein